MASARSISKKAAKPSKTPGLTDAQFARLIRKAGAAAAEVKAAEQVSSALKSDVLKELARRKVDYFQYRTIQVVRRTRPIRTVDLVKMGEKLGAAVFNKLTERRLNRDAWNGAVQSNLIPESVVAEIETTEQSAPWIEITEVEEP